MGADGTDRCRADSDLGRGRKKSRPQINTRLSAFDLCGNRRDQWMAAALRRNCSAVGRRSDAIVVHDRGRERNARKPQPDFRNTATVSVEWHCCGILLNRMLYADRIERSILSTGHVSGQ